MSVLASQLTLADYLIYSYMIVQRTGFAFLAGTTSPGVLSSALTAVPSIFSHIGGGPARLLLV